jgi:PAS domain S-box-containing protein
MSLSARFSIGSYRMQFLLALLSLLLAAFAAIMAINLRYHHQVADEHVRELSQQGLKRVEGRLTAITGLAAEQNEVLQSLVRQQQGKIDLEQVLSELAPAFIARPILSFVGIGLESTGEYAMLERTGGGKVRLRHFAILPDGQREIRDSWADEANRLQPAGVLPWNGYDPRTRPFYVVAKKAGHAVWTDSYLFSAGREGNSSLGVTLAVPLYDRAGGLLGVADTDFDAGTLSSFISELQHDLPGRIFLVEEREDGTRRVVAHSDFASLPVLQEKDFARDPLPREVISRLPDNFRLLRQTGRGRGILSFSLGDEGYIASYELLEGPNLPGWLAVAALPRSAAMSALNQIQGYSLLALIGVAMAGTIMAGYMARRVTRPLVRLADEVEKLAEGPEGKLLREEGPDEVVLLARRFNTMTGRLRARQAELAAAESELRAHTERLKQTSETMLRAAEIVSRAGADALSCAREMVRLACEARHLSIASIWLRIPESTRYIRQASYDAQTQSYRPTIEGDTKQYPELFEAFEREGRIITTDSSTDPRLARIYADRLSHLGRVATLGVSMRAHNEMLGHIIFHLINDDRPWTPEDEMLARSIADLLALAVERDARRQTERTIRAQAERLARQESALSRATRSQPLREGRLETAFAELSEICNDGLGVTRASIWLFRRPGRHLQLIDLYNRERGEHARGAIVDFSAASPYYNALQHDRIVAADDARADPRTTELTAGYLVPAGITSMLDAGVFSRGELVGAVCFEHLGPTRHWEPDEELFAGSIADLAALALEAAARGAAEEEIVRSRERLQQFIQAAPLAVIDWDRHIRIMGWNPAAEHIFGHVLAEVLGRDGFFLSPPEERVKLAGLWHDLALGRAGYLARATGLTKDGRLVYCDWHNTVLRDEKGYMIGATSIVEDVTERVRTEEEIRQLNAGLERRVAERTADLEAANEKLKELDRLKSEFLAMMSHELRTPLNSIIGFTGILKQGMAGPINEEQFKQLEMVYVSARHLLGLINDLLDLSRIEAGRFQLEMREFSPAIVIRDAVDSLGPMVRLKQLEFVVEEADPAVVIRGDRKRFVQIVVNLANNAVKFTEHGGVRMTMRLQGDQLWVRVTDTGPGIRREHLGRLFEAFRQIDGSARRVYEGTGLGLYLCRKLVRLLGGEIGVETDFGHGATFWFWIPRAGLPPANAELVSASPFVAS